MWRLVEMRHQGQSVVPPLCFSRFYPAYFRDRYRSRTGKDSENEIGCGFLDWKLGAMLLIGERKIAFPTEIGYFSTFRRGIRSG